MDMKESNEMSTKLEVTLKASVHSSTEDFYIKYGYIPVSILGTGMTGDVMMVTPRDGSNNLKAVKIFTKKTQDGGKKNHERFIQEVAILQIVQQKHILGNIMAFDCPKESVILMPYYPEGSLKSQLEMTIEVTDKYLIQLTSAIVYLHSRHLAHRDIKPANILISDDDNVILTDFGLSCVVPSTHMSDVRRCGTRDFMAPELLNKTTQFFNLYKCDMYALGVVLLSMLICAEADQSDVAVFVNLHSQESDQGHHNHILKNLLERGPENRWDSTDLAVHLSSLPHIVELFTKLFDNDTPDVASHTSINLRRVIILTMAITLFLLLVNLHMNLFKA